MRQEVLKEAAFDEVVDSQRSFKTLMDAMSRPGQLYRLQEHHFSKAPENFNPNILTVLKTLGDNNITFSSCNLKDETVQRYIEVNTGVIPAEVNEADYILFDGGKFDGNICSAKAGSLEFPENSATVIFAVKRILCGQYKGNDMDRIELHMKGPGIKDVNIVTIIGLDKKFVQGTIEMNSVYPLGIDLIFVDEEGSIICMPRTAKAEVK